MTVDAEYDEVEGTELFLVGGQVNQGGATDEAFLYTFVDGAECGLRHSYRITTMTLGIQGVTITENKIMAIALTQGKEASLGIKDKTNVIIRASKTDPTDEPEFFRVDFVGDEAGAVADRQTVLKMVNFNDNQIAIQSLSEVRFINLSENRVHGLYTLNLGDQFWQRDIYAVKQSKLITTPQTEWNLYMAYPRYDYIEEKLYLLVDRVTVDTTLTLSNQENIFHGLAQSNPDIKEYRTIRFAVSEESQFMAICGQIATSDLIGQTKTRNLFFSIELQEPTNRQVQLKAIDQPLGSNYECEATGINDAGTIAYILLNDSESHRTKVFEYELLTNTMLEYKTEELPYTTIHKTHTQRGLRAVFVHNADFILANIDTALYGISTQNNMHVGYLVDSRSSRRLNPYMQNEQTPISFSLETSFQSDPYSRSFLYVDYKVERQNDPITQDTYFVYDVTLNDVSLKTPWIDFFCPQSGTTVGSFENLSIQLGVSFDYVFRGVQSMTNIESTCYPHLIATFDGPVTSSDIVGDLTLVTDTLTFKVKPTDLDHLGETVIIFGGIVGDAYLMDTTLFDKKFEHTVYTVVQEPTTNALPGFATPLEELKIMAESSFSYSLPEVTDVEIFDQVITVTLDNTGKEWLILSDDKRRVYTEPGASTSGLVGDYVFTITLNDGYQFGPNESSFELKVSIISKTNNLPYFKDPGLVPQSFYAEEAFTYVLPELVDEDGDQVTLTLETSGVDWLKLSADKKSLEVEAGATIGLDMVKSYDFILTLEDDSSYGQARTQSFTLTVTIEIPPNTLPTFDGLLTEITVVAEEAWSYELPAIISTEAKDVVTVESTDEFPWLKLDTTTKVLSIDEGALFGNITLDVYRFALVLDDNNIYGPGKTIYQMKIEVIAPGNTLPQFFEDKLNRDDVPFSTIQGEEFSYKLPAVTDPEHPEASIQISVDNSNCPWLGYNILTKSLQISKGATTVVEPGKYAFTVKLSDRFPYAYNTNEYIGEIEVFRSNTLPYFFGQLPATLTFRAEAEWEFVLPDLIDDDGDDVFVVFDILKFPWLRYDRTNNKLYVDKLVTTADDVGEYTLTINLEDGQNQGFSTYFTFIVIDIPERPFHIYAPQNKAPKFLLEPTTEELQFDTGAVWEYLLPEIFDFDRDKVIISITSNTTPFLKLDQEPPRIYIEEGATTKEDVEKYTVRIRLTDIPVEGADPLSTDYSIKIFGVDPEYLENLARSEPPPVQVGASPQIRVQEISQYGIMKISISSGVSFPADIKEKINKFTDAIVIAPNKPYFPTPNKFGFVEIPYVKMQILASVESEVEDLKYAWSVTDVTSTSMTFELLFDNPLQVSLQSDPEQINLEFHIQEFVNSDGKGVRDNKQIQKFIPRQVKNDAATQALTATGDQLSQTTDTLMYIQVGINLVLNSAMEKLWIMVNGLQLIVIIPLLPVKLPPNTQMILVAFIDFACFDLVPVDLIYPSIFDFLDSDPFNFEFQSAGYDSGYLPENMGTVFTFTHIFALALLISLPLYLLKNKSRCAKKTYARFKSALMWNPVVIFFLEGFMEIALCAMAVIKRWDWNSDPNSHINIIYALIYMIIVLLYPIITTVIFCRNKHLIDKKIFRRYVGGPFDGLKRNHKNRNIFYVTYYMARRVIFVITVVLVEQNLLLSIWTMLISTEVSFCFLAVAKPFEDGLRNSLEIFNELILITMVMTTFCFTGNMEPETTAKIGWWFLGILAFFMAVHLTVIISDTFIGFCRVIWRLLSKCGFGKIIQDRIKRRIKLLRAPKLEKKPKAKVLDTIEEVSSESESIDTPDSSMEIDEYEEIINQYTNRVTERQNVSQQSSRVPESSSGDDSSTRRDATAINNLLIIQRNHEIPDPIDNEMDFWMGEIERMEQENAQRRVELGIDPEPNVDQQPVAMSEVENANPQGLIFVPEDWMEDMKNDNDDNAFEHDNDNGAEVLSLNQNSKPVQVKRKKKPVPKRQSWQGGRESTFSGLPIKKK